MKDEANGTEITHLKFATWKELAEMGWILLSNSQPDSSLDEVNRKAWFARFADYLESYHELKDSDK